MRQGRRLHVRFRLRKTLGYQIFCCKVAEIRQIRNRKKGVKVAILFIFGNSLVCENAVEFNNFVIGYPIRLVLYYLNSNHFSSNAPFRFRYVKPHLNKFFKFLSFKFPQKTVFP